MDDCSPYYKFTDEFRREHSIRRAIAVLEAKRRQIRDEIEQSICHISFLVPPSGSRQEIDDVLAEAVDRLGDDAFTKLFLGVLREGENAGA